MKNYTVILTFAGLITGAVLFASSAPHVNKSIAVAQEQSVNSTRFGLKALRKIIEGPYYGSNLYYDENTLNVYYWNGFTNNRSSTMPTACYAPNGLQYKYDPDTCSLVEPDISQYIIKEE